jgi:stress response protein YsnF
VVRERRNLKVPVTVETAITLTRRRPAAWRPGTLPGDSSEVVVPVFREEVRLTAVPRVYERVRLVRSVERTTEQVREDVRREELVEERKELDDR